METVVAPDEWDANIGQLAAYHTTCPAAPVPATATSSTG
jgi:hypothetical protein